MLFVDARRVADALPYDALIDALDRAFCTPVIAPQRVHHTIDQGAGSDATLLLMPAWSEGGSIGIKIATLFPDNALHNKGAVNAIYCLMNGSTGEPEAVIDGAELTLRRTACASALAARYLARDDAATLLMVGTGNLAPHMVAAHAAARKLEHIRIWGRNADKAAALAASLAENHRNVSVVSNLDVALPEADIVSCATLSSTPLVRGALLRPGQHIDLVGAYTPQMREADGEAMGRARVYVDTYAGAFSEAGEIVQAIDEGYLQKDSVAGELAELASGKVAGRTSGQEITLFKSVGTALEDLAAAELLISNAGAIGA